MNRKARWWLQLKGFLDPNRHSIVCFQDACATIRDRGTQGSKKKEGGSKERVLGVRNSRGKSNGTIKGQKLKKSQGKEHEVPSRYPHLKLL